MIYIGRINLYFIVIYCIIHFYLYLRSLNYVFANKQKGFEAHIKHYIDRNDRNLKKIIVKHTINYSYIFAVIYYIYLLNFILLIF